MILLHWRWFRHSSHGIALNFFHALTKKLVWLVPGILLIILLISENMHGWTFFGTVNCISIPSEENGFDTKHVTQEVRLNTYLLLNGLLEDKHLFLHLAFFSVRHSFLPHFDYVWDSNCYTSKKLGCTIYVYTRCLWWLLWVFWSFRIWTSYLTSFTTSLHS